MSLPLVYLGSLLGYRLPKYHMPVRTNHIERQIPAQPWYLRPGLTCFVGGCIPFGAIFLEIYFLMSSIMSHQMYVVFGFLLAIFVLMLITTAEIAIVLCYFQLASEDYRWWWRSFVNTGCTALFVFAFSLFYMLSHGITKVVSGRRWRCVLNSDFVLVLDDDGVYRSFFGLWNHWILRMFLVYEEDLWFTEGRLSFLFYTCCLTS